MRDTETGPKEPRICDTTSYVCFPAITSKLDRMEAAINHSRITFVLLTKNYIRDKFALYSAEQATASNKTVYYIRMDADPDVTAFSSKLSHVYLLRQRMMQMEEFKTMGVAITKEEAEVRDLAIFEEFRIILWGSQEPAGAESQQLFRKRYV